MANKQLNHIFTKEDVKRGVEEMVKITQVPYYRENVGKAMKERLENQTLPPLGYITIMMLMVADLEPKVKGIDLLFALHKLEEKLALVMTANEAYAKEAEKNMTLIRA